MDDSDERKHAEVTASHTPAQSLQAAYDEMKARIARTNAEMARVAAEIKRVSANWRARKAERQRADYLRHDSEARPRLALEAAGMAIWDWDIINQVFDCSDQLGAMMGLRPGERCVSYEAFLSSIHEEDRDLFLQAINRVLEEQSEFSLEFRVVWPDGSIHWHASRGRLLADQSERLVGVAMDITPRKQAEESRYHWLNQIVEAQEEERRRVSRELHDQMGQDLAAMIVGLEALKSKIITPATLEGVRELQELANHLSQKVHSLAWELRPPALDDLGLHTALERFVEHWSERSGVAVDWYIDGFQSRRLPPPVETTLYRVVQEALTNVLKHAQAKRVSLIMRASTEEVTAIIEDDGRGFDAECTMRSPDPDYKLGLVGMQERVLLVKGTLSIESVSNQGTTVYVRIPLNQL